MRKNNYIEKYKTCSICGKEPSIKTENDKLYISCTCGLYIVANNYGKILKHRYELDGNTYCVLCGSKVEGGYCNCFSKQRS